MLQTLAGADGPPRAHRNCFWLDEISQVIGHARLCTHGAIHFNHFALQAAAVRVQPQIHIGNRQIAQRDCLTLGIARGFKGLLCLLKVLDLFGDIQICIA